MSKVPSLPNSSKPAVRHDRRGILKAGATLAGTAALLSAIKAVTPAGASAAGTDGIEKPKLNLGFIPLTDCAPLVVANEKGFFKKHSLDVTLSKEASWANIRDKVMIGALDGAHMLAGMPLAPRSASAPSSRRPLPASPWTSTATRSPSPPPCTSA